MSTSNMPMIIPSKRAWNNGRIIGQKRPLLPKQVWAIRVRLEIAGAVRDLALFNLAVDSKLRGCDLVKLKVADVFVSGAIKERVSIIQTKTQTPVRFEITDGTRKSLKDWIGHPLMTGHDYLWPGRFHDRNANGAPLLVSGNRVIVIDPTGLATARTWLHGLTSSIFGVLNGTGGYSNGNSPQSAGLAVTGDGSLITPVAATDATGTGWRMWGSVLGGARDQEGLGPTVDANLQYGGLIAGGEGISHGDFSLGFFLGGALADNDVQFGLQGIEVDSVFGGLYAQRDWQEGWIKLIIAGGWADHEARRVVANNAVAGGVETAKADYDGFFIAPAITMGTRIHGVVPDHVLIPSVRVNYAGLFLDGYTESGVMAPLTVSDRDIHLFGTRAQLALPHIQHGTDGAELRFETRLGVEGSFSLGGDRVRGSVIGVPLSFNASFDHDIVTGFVGFAMTRISGDGAYSFTASVEGHKGSDDSEELRGHLKATVRF